MIQTTTNLDGKKFNKNICQAKIAQVSKVLNLNKNQNQK